MTNTQLTLDFNIVSETDVNIDEVRKKKRQEYLKAYRESHKEKLKSWREANKDELKAKQKAYRESHKEERKALCKAWYEANKDKVKTYCEANADNLKAKHKEYREANKDKIKKYREANKDKIKAWYEANKNKIDLKRKLYREANADKARARSKEWLKIHQDNITTNVKIINVDSKEAANELEDKLINKHSDTICNKLKSNPLPKVQVTKGVERPLKIMGENIKLARLRRRLSISQLCERAGLGRTTFWKIENGSPDVAIAAYANVLMVLGLEKELEYIGQADPVGRKIQDMNLLYNK